MDPLSEVLKLLTSTILMSGGVDIGGKWSFRFKSFEGIKFYALTSGELWVEVENSPAPVRMVAGDCFLLPHGLPFLLASDLTLEPTDLVARLETPLNGAIRTLNDGGCCTLGAHVTFTGSNANYLLNVLPSIVHIRNQTDRSVVRWCLDQLMLELRAPRPGSALISQQLANTVLIQALRIYLEEDAKDRSGWLFALSDKRMSMAIQLMHQAPSYHWTLQDLASRVGMSRTAFSVAFKERVGQSPMDYLRGWRMLLAAERLAGSREQVSSIARALGYESESAFSVAFKRTMGRSPREHRRDHKR